MNIQFCEFNSFDLWLWLEFETVLSEQEKQYLEEVFDSWFFLGKLGDLMPRICKCKMLAMN